MFALVWDSFRTHVTAAVQGRALRLGAGKNVLERLVSCSSLLFVQTQSSHESEGGEAGIPFIPLSANSLLEWPDDTAAKWRVLALFPHAL